MAISDTIQSMKEHLQSAYTKLQDKGATIPTNKNMENLASTIETVSTGTDTSDATATANDILAGKTAYVASGKVTGTIETYDGETETPPDYVYTQDGTVVTLLAAPYIQTNSEVTIL